ncbi:MAG TPA: cysteine--tRNA ligase [Candidatus Tyrphobacter sp.]|nr:cysteine--tRNA ligase [Candidatus Tyrphobacter sp.]
MLLYNFLTRKKEKLKPLRGKNVGLYTCGPTVYNYAHIGNFRKYLFDDVLRRTLKLEGFKVKQVMNITDIDDKIVKKSIEEKKTIPVITDFYLKEFLKDLDKLNIEKAEIYPRATEHVKEIISLIGTLLRKKIAYRESDGSVYFDISKFKNYGRLSLLEKRKIKTGARVAADEYDKENAEDFVLWKAQKPGEPAWPSPFGPGRPGWHIECSAMSMKYLGAHFDIHTGGIDHLFPHHENEIAQSEAATGKKFVNYWLESEHLLIQGEKMSKSLNNIFTVKDLEERGFNPLAFRYLVLGAHYRTRLNFTWESIGAAREALKNIYLEIGRIAIQAGGAKVFRPKEFSAYDKKFREALADDLNTPAALAVLWEVLKTPRIQPAAKKTLLLEFDEVLGLNFKRAFAFSSEIAASVRKIAKERELVRTHQQFIKADSLRKKIEALGYKVEDTVAGQLIFREYRL